MKRITVKTSIHPEEYKQALLEDSDITNKLNQSLIKVFAMNMFEAGYLHLNIEEATGIASGKIYDTMLNMDISGFVWDMNDHFTFLKLLKDLKKTCVDDNQLSIINKMVDILSIEIDN